MAGKFNIFVGTCVLLAGRQPVECTLTYFFPMYSMGSFKHNVKVHLAGQHGIVAPVKIRMPIGAIGLFLRDGQVHQCSANIPPYSMVLVSNSLQDVAQVFPAAKDLSNHLVPFLTDLVNTLNSLSNVIRNLTPTMLPYFGLNLPLLYAALADIFSILMLYVGTLVSLLRTGSLGYLSMGAVKSLLDLVQSLLKKVTDKKGILDGVVKALGRVIKDL